MKAHAVIAVEPGKIEYRTVNVPEPGAEDVVIRLTHSWISPGTERSFILGERINGETARTAEHDMPFPQAPGYQKTGIVEAVGAAVPGIQPGDRVFATVSAISDLYFSSGGHISPAVTHYSQVWPVPEHLSSTEVSGLVLTQVGYNCGARAALQTGDRAVVLGDGLVGQWAAQTLAHRGARVMLAGRHDERLAKFDAGPVHQTVNVRETDLSAAIKAWSDQPVQVVVDTIGAIAQLEALIDQMARDSHFVSAGFHATSGRIDIQKLRMREISLHTPSGWTRPRMDATLELLAQGALQTEPLVTHHFPAAEATDAYHLILTKSAPFLGIVLDW